MLDENMLTSKCPMILHKKIDAVDYISQLPEHLMHHILSFLPTKDILCTSILSKTWQGVWASFPICDFDENSFKKITLCTEGKNSEVLVKSNEFRNFVDDSLRRICENKINLETFKLVMIRFDVTIASSIDGWIELVRKNNLKTLDLSIRGTKRNTRYDLPESILALKSLTVLRLRGCKLKKSSFSETVKFISLQVLSLVYVYVDEQIVQNLIISCPLIKIFTLYRCYGVKNLQLSCLPQLEKVEVHQNRCMFLQTESIKIKSSSLQTLLYNGAFEKCKLDVTSCKNIKELSLQNILLDEEKFQGLISKFPLISTLVLRYCDGLKRVRISSHKLKILKFHYLKWLDEAEIDTPNLHSFEYIQYSSSRSLISIDTSSLQKAVLKIIVDHQIDTLCFLELRELLEKFGPNKVLTLYIKDSSLVKWNLETLRDTSIAPPYVIQRLGLHMLTLPQNYKDLVDCLLWSYHPRTLSIVLPRPDNYIFIESLCEKLIEKGDNPKCCNSSHIKCWRHYLKDFQITRIGDGKTFHCKDLLESLPTNLHLLENKHSLTSQEIQFDFEWSIGDPFY